MILSIYSLASSTPAGPTENDASLSAIDGESMTLHTRFSPLAFLSCRRVCDACAMMFPPIGLVASFAKLIPSGFATT